MALGKRAWRWRKRAWRGAIIKVARGNTTNASFLRDLTNDQNFFAFSFFRGQSGTIGISAIRIKREDFGNMFPICISDDLLNMCSEPFVMALNVRAA